MNRRSSLSIPLALVLVGCPKEAECPEPPLVTPELRVATRTISADLVALSDAFVDLDLDESAQRALTLTVPGSYAPWGLDDDEPVAAQDNPLYQGSSNTGVNPLFGDDGTAPPLHDDLPGWAAATSPAELAAARDRAGHWQGVIAGIVVGAQLDDSWDDPVVQAALHATWMDVAGARCVLTELAEGRDDELDVCTAAADLIGVTAWLGALADVTHLLAETQASRHATLMRVRDLALTYLDAVGDVYAEGEALTLAQALVDEANAAVAATDATTGVAGLPEVLAREASSLASDDDLRRVLREPDLHTAAHEAAHVVQQRSAAIDGVFDLDYAFEACPTGGLDCALTAARVRVHAIHRGQNLKPLRLAAQDAFAAAADKAPIPEAKAALRTALEDADTTFGVLLGDEDRLMRQLQTVSNVLKTKHDTAKNSVSNIR